MIILSQADATEQQEKFIAFMNEEALVIKQLLDIEDWSTFFVLVQLTKCKALPPFYAPRVFCAKKLSSI